MWNRAGERERDAYAALDARGYRRGSRRVTAPRQHYMSIQWILILLGDHRDVMRPDAHWARYIALLGAKSPQFVVPDQTPIIDNSAFPVVQQSFCGT